MMKYTTIILLTLYLLQSSCREYGPMRDFALLLPDSTSILNSKDLPMGKPIVAVYFSPDCKNCQDETKDILQNIDAMKDLTFVFITPDELSAMKKFIAYYRLNTQPNVVVGKEINYSFMNAVRPSGIPFTCIFDKNKRLRIVFPTGAKSKQIISSSKNL